MDASGIGYLETYLVGYTGKYDEVALLYSADGRLPKYLGGKATDANVYCSKVEIDAAEGDYYGLAATDNSVVAYIVTWSQKSITYDPNPLNRPAQIDWGGTDITEVVAQDTTGLAIANSAGDLYQPLPERPIRGAECTITRNESGNPATMVTLFSYTTCTGTWYGVPGANVLFGKITASKQIEIYNGAQLIYWRVTYPIRFNRNGWAVKIIDNGFRTVDGSGNATNIIDNMGNTTPTPVLLDGHGNELASGGTPVIYPSAGYKVAEQTNWPSLNLPNPFA